MKTKDFTITEDSGKEVKLSVKPPQNEDFEESDKVYGARIAALIRESSGPTSRKLLMRSKVEEFLRDQGVWSEEDEKNVRALQEEVDSLLTQIRRGGIKLSDGRELAIKVMDKRKEIVRIMSKRQMFDDSTIEAIAESEKVDYLIYACTVYAQDGKNYWMSFEDMKNDKTSQAYRKAAVIAYEVIYGVNPEFEKRLPENRWLLKYGFIDDDLNYIDRKTGKRVDKTGKPVDEIIQEVQKQKDNLEGEIVEEKPFIDDETNSPVVVESKKEESEQKSEDSESKEPTTEVS